MEFFNIPLIQRQNGALSVKAPITLTEGQFIFGKLVKFLPNQLALIQVTGQSILASVDVPLEAGKGYWFQVESLNQGTQFKLVEPPNVRNQKTAPSSQLLQQLSLQGSKENRVIIEELMKHGSPVTKTTIEQISQWTKGYETSHIKSALHDILVRGLPLTEGVVHSFLKTIPNEESFSSLLFQLKVGLDKIQLPLNDTVRQSLQQILEPKLVEKHQQVFFSLMDRLQGTSSNEYKQHVGQLLSAVLPTVVSGKVNEAKQGFTQSDEGNPITKATSNYTNFHSELMHDQKNSNMSKNPIPNLQVFSHELAVHVNGVNVPMTKERLESLALLFEQTIASVTKLPEPLKKELLAVQSEIEAMMHKQHTQNMYVEIKNILSRLGLGEEAELIKDEYKPTLKAAILSLLREEIPASLRDVSEKIMAKLNVQTLVSQPPGDFHHLQFSVPLNFLGLNTDLQLEWTGKKKEDGTINPDYCRVIFYLDLEMLSSLMIDMQVQNRIISIKIYTDFPEIKTIGAHYTNSLKSKVDELGYKVSSLQFYPMAEKVGTKRHQTSILSEKGVDITI